MGKLSKQRNSQSTGQQEVPHRSEASQGGCNRWNRASEGRAVRDKVGGASGDLIRRRLAGYLQSSR